MRIKGQFLTFLLGVMTLLALFVAPKSAAAQSNAIGINISSVSGYDSDRLFADAMKHARPFAPAGNPGGAALTAPNIDANGWPTGDASVLIWEGAANQNGTYHLSYTGAGSFSLGGIAYSVANQSYNASANTTSADILISDAGSGNVWLNFTGVSGGAKNIKLMRPTYPGSSVSYAANVTFTDQMKNLIGKFSAIRFMDFTATNWNEIINWSDRPKQSYATQQPPSIGYNTGWQGRGAAWEYAIQLANETNKDAWICIPVSASDDYITQLATLWKNNLNPGLKLYVEYSNEVWNGSFSQFHINLNNAVNEVVAGGSPLNYDNLPLTKDANGNYDNRYNWAFRRTGKRAVEISNIFRSVFGDAAMMTRIRPVIEWQQGNNSTGFLHLAMAEYLARQNNRAVNYYLWGGGGSAYYNPQNDSDSLDINNIWTSETFNTPTWAAAPLQISDADLCAAYGIVRAAYEGGPSMDNLGHSEAIKRQAWGDSRMKTLVVDHQNLWSSYNGGLLMYFNSTGAGDYQWAFTDYPWNLSSYKLQAVDTINSSIPAGLTIGQIIPANLAGGAFSIASRGYGFPGSGSGSVNIQSGQWFGWTGRNTSNGSYNIVVNLSSNGTGTLRLVADGVTLGTYDYPNTVGAAQDSSAFSVSLNAGLHGIRVESVSGSFDVQQLKITNGGGTVAAPTFSPAAGTYSSAQNVTISTTTSGASIRYTTDGTTPTSSTGTVYSGAVNVASSLTLKAIAYKSGSTDSAVTSGAYTINAGGSGTGLRGTYFNTNDLSGSSALVRTDATVNFDWGTGSYTTGGPTDNFSVRWEGQVQATTTGTYTFSTTSDDGVRLWVNGTQVINNWTDHAPTTDTSAGISLTAGQKYDIKMEFYEKGGGAVAKLLWTPPGGSLVAIPQSQLYPATTTALPLQINAGGSAATPYIADAYYSGGTAATNWTGAIDTSGVTNPAPAAVYQAERYGAVTYTIPGLSGGASVTVRLHFCENYFTAANARKFNVAINGASVLSNFDIYATAGAIHKAVVQSFTATVNASGQVIIALTNGSANNALINGIEILAGGGSPPSAPTGLSATAGNAQVSLSWTASTGATSYNVKRSTTNGGPYSTVASPTGTSYTNTGLTNGTTYYYVVTAVNANGESGNSNQASATPSGGPVTVTLNPTDDTDTQSDVAAGTNPSLNSSQWNTIFARFDFTSVTGTVTNAKFRIYKEATSSALSCIASQTTTDSWTQSNRGALPGVGSAIQTITAANGVGYIEFDVTALVQSRMSGTKIASFALNTAIGTWTSFTAKEGANKPQLVITAN